MEGKPGVLSLGVSITLDFVMEPMSFEGSSDSMYGILIAGSLISLIDFFFSIGLCTGISDVV